MWKHEPLVSDFRQAGIVFNARDGGGIGCGSGGMEKEGRNVHKGESLLMLVTPPALNATRGDGAFKQFQFELLQSRGGEENLGGTATDRLKTSYLTASKIF